jgi:oligoendopeptidase F
MYKLIEKGKPISTYEKISKVYYENSQKYALKKKKYNSNETFMSVIVPHFYYNFYVYKYAIGQLCAMIFFEKYKKEGPKALQFYINNFLSAGNKK